MEYTPDHVLTFDGPRKGLIHLVAYGSAYVSPGGANHKIMRVLEKAGLSIACEWVTNRHGQEKIRYEATNLAKEWVA